MQYSITQISPAYEPYSNMAYYGTMYMNFGLIFIFIFLDEMIRLLKPELQSMLRSEVAITSQTECVEELVYNSLDAGATCIAVRVQFEEGNIQVVDNGKGIEKSQLAYVAERY